jgi:uncharacterized membrane protein HdeD (DUF308 family)
LRVEFVIPLLFGLLLLLVGVTLLFDAWTPDELVVPPERRRRPRAERDRAGETLLGLGMIAVGAAFIGRDVWGYRVVAMAVGAILLLIGAVRNRHLLHELVANRGKLRRRAPPEALAPPDAAAPPETVDSSERLRIR